MKTTQQWLTEIKASSTKLNHWLTRQYVGEALAASRICELAETQEDTRCKTLLNKIALDEDLHCQWVADLLLARNIKLPNVSYENTRYWEPILGKISTFEEITAVGHHAETMRLLRIRALVNDLEIDEDIRQVFKNILPDEEFHAKAFAALTNEETIESTRHLHQAGLDMLGLEV